MECQFNVDVGLNWLLETEVCLKKCQKYIQTTKKYHWGDSDEYFFCHFLPFLGGKKMTPKSGKIGVSGALHCKKPDKIQNAQKWPFRCVFRSRLGGSGPLMTLPGRTVRLEVEFSEILDFLNFGNFGFFRNL